MLPPRPEGWRQRRAAHLVAGYGGYGSQRRLVGVDVAGRIAWTTVHLCGQSVGPVSVSTAVGDHLIADRGVLDPATGTVQTYADPGLIVIPGGAAIGGRYVAAEATGDSVSVQTVDPDTYALSGSRVHGPCRWPRPVA